MPWFVGDTFFVCSGFRRLLTLNGEDDTLYSRVSVYSSAVTCAVHISCSCHQLLHEFSQAKQTLQTKTTPARRQLGIERERAEIAARLARYAGSHSRLCRPSQGASPCSSVLPQNITKHVQCRPNKNQCLSGDLDALEFDNYFRNLQLQHKCAVLGS